MIYIYSVAVRHLTLTIVPPKIAIAYIRTIRSGEVYSIQHYVIKFVSDLRQVGGFLRYCTPVSSTNKTDRHDITEILLKVALNTITLTYYTISVERHLRLVS